MARMYTRTAEFGRVALDNWPLLERLQKVFDPYRPIVTGREGWALFTAVDERGQYTAKTVAELRELVKEQDEPPHEIRLFVAGRDVYGHDYELGLALTTSESRALLYSESEQMVDHLRARLETLLQGGGSPSEAQAPSGAKAAAVSSQASPDSGRGPLRRFLYNPWVIAVGAPVGVAGILALIAFLAGFFGGHVSGRTASQGPNTSSSHKAVIETAGGTLHTWTDYNDAGGTAGPLIDAFKPITVSCRTEGFQVTDGNVWWYRIASSPWRNHFYASADGFYNNGAASGPLRRTPFVDSKVPRC